MAILLEKDLILSNQKSSAYILAGYIYSKIIPINNTIIGSLITQTNTYDYYEIKVEKPTLIRVKFNVEQTTNAYDYYNFYTPIGSFYGKPDSNKFPENGIDFLIQSSAFFLIEGSNQGVFNGNYALEITEIKQGYWNNYIPLRKYDSKIVNIGSNNTIDAWNEVNLKLETIPLMKDETGTFVVYLDHIKGYGNSEFGYYNTFIYPNYDVRLKDFISITIKNEGMREIFKSDNIFGKNTILIPNLNSGIFYMDVYSNQNFATQYKLQVNFYKTFNDKESVVYNTNGLDRFPDWDQKLDKVIYFEAINNFNISKSNALGHFNISHKVKTSDYDVLESVERVVFSDKTIAFDFSSNEAGYKSAMLIAASFGKEYIPTFFSKGLIYFDSGSTTKEIAKLIADNKFIEQLIGDNSDSAWVKHVYKNVVGVYPDKASETNYVTLLQNKTNTRSELLELAAGFTFLESRIDLVGLQTNGLVFDTLS